MSQTLLPLYDYKIIIKKFTMVCTPFIIIFVIKTAGRIVSDYFCLNVSDKLKLLERFNELRLHSL